MKKISALIFSLVIALSVAAQEHGYIGNKFTDNWYVGLNGGIAVPTTHHAVFRNIDPNFGLRLGKGLSPTFGLALEANGFFAHKLFDGDKGSPFKYFQLGVLVPINLTNAIKPYMGIPRKFEVQFVPGFLWGHNIGKEVPGTVLNFFVNKIAFDFCYNFGKDLQWQAYVEPGINFAIGGIDDGFQEEGVQKNLVNYNINHTFLQLNVGIIYKFMTSNGTHNFSLVESCNDDEIDNINDLINQMREQMEEQDGVVATVEKENSKIEQDIQVCADTPAEVVEEFKQPDLPTVFYQVNKSTITPAQESNVAVAAEVLRNHPEYKLRIKGYASPEGGHSNNMSLGVRRAEAVKTMLVNKFGIAADRITAEGCDPTDELFPVYEFNRVAVLFLEK